MSADDRPENAEVVDDPWQASSAEPASAIDAFAAEATVPRTPDLAASSAVTPDPSGFPSAPAFPPAPVFPSVHAPVIVRRKVPLRHTVARVGEELVAWFKTLV